MDNSTPDIRIEKMNPGQLSSILKIEKSVFKDPWTAASFVEVMSFSPDCWAALAGDEVVGYVVTQWILDEIHILNIAVAAEMHRKGVGTRLLDYVITEGLKHNMKDVFLEVRVGNSAAISLYERFEFKALTIRKKYYTDGEDALVMHRTLPAQESDANETSMDAAGSKTEEK
jgi:ribosomal-protein-alanine N-acetyltransferase